MEFLAIAIVSGFGAVLSYMALRDALLIDKPWFSLPAACVSVVLFVWAVRLCLAAGYPWLLASLIVAFPFGISHAYFVATLVGNAMRGTARFMMGDKNIEVAPTFDMAEAALKRGEFDQAIALFEEAVRTWPKSPTPQVHMADALIRLQRFPEAAGCLRKAVALIPEPADASPVVFRLADVLAKQMGQRDQAAQVLQDFIRRYPDTKFADYARERLAGLG